MKQAVQKKRAALSVISRAHFAPAINVFNANPYSSSRSFTWSSGAASDSRRQLRPLTTEDFLQVNLATVRESNTHRLWPPYVIAKFRRAEVITRKPVITREHCGEQSAVSDCD